MMSLKFKVVDSGFEEDLNLKLSPEKLAMHLAKGKARAVALNYPNAIIIAADTIIVHKKKIYGKPYTKPRAIKMLKELSGTTHWAMTGLCVMDTMSGKMVAKTVKTKVVLRKLHHDEIIKYVKEHKPYDYAGAYGLFGKAAVFAKRVEGEYYNVIGLPPSELSVILRGFGIKI